MNTASMKSIGSGEFILKIATISLEKLKTNASNDRHGDVASSENAVTWLLQHRGPHMRALTRDIVKEGQIYEPPLVHADDGNYTVFDGNRRVTCLKLIASPSLSPTDEWRSFFQTQRDAWSGEVPKAIECQIEEDRDRIDEILFRRHTGAQSGIGQSQWDDEAKSNFIWRTGKKARVNVAELIEGKLKETGLLDSGAKVPRSNLNRLLSAENFRNRVGIRVSKNHLEFTHEKDAVLGALARIASDLISKEITLDDLWDQKTKSAYLKELQDEGILPTPRQALKVTESFKSAQIPKRAKTSTSPLVTSIPRAKPRRSTLIRTDTDYAIEPTPENLRIVDIWQELQHRLKFGSHDNAISVLFRVLIELSIEHYITQNPQLRVYENDKLAKKFRKALDDMFAKGVIDKSYHDALLKFEHNDALLSANTLNKFVHSKDFFPSDTHLKSMWDTLSRFVVICLNKNKW